MYAITVVRDTPIYGCTADDTVVIHSDLLEAKKDLFSKAMEILCGALADEANGDEAQVHFTVSNFLPQAIVQSGDHTTVITIHGTVCK